MAGLILTLAVLLTAGAIALGAASGETDKAALSPASGAETVPTSQEPAGEEHAGETDDDGTVWLVRRQDYEAGLRKQGSRMEILLRRDEDVTVVDSVPFDAGSGTCSLLPFDDIPELSGFVLENRTSDGWGDFYYYMVKSDSILRFANSFGGERKDIAQDLDGDGKAELLCNVAYHADGVTDVLVYRIKEGVPQAASVEKSMLRIPENKHLARPASAAYDGDTGLVTLEYQLAGEDDLRVETVPINYDSLQFQDFTGTW